MDADPAEGWEGIANQFIASRSAIGASTVRRWARQHLPPSAPILDVGCGSGFPIAAALVADGFGVFAVDASPTLVAAFRARFPDAPAACEDVRTSPLFGRTFPGVLAIGLLFLLSEADQRAVLPRLVRAVTPGGRLLFTAPAAPLEWSDSLTGRRSVSLGTEEYAAIVQDAGARLAATFLDEGENHYFDSVVDDKNTR